MEVRLPTKADWDQLQARYRGPALVLSALGGLVEIVKFIFWLLDWKSRIEEAVTTGEQFGSLSHSVFGVIVSPWFGISLIAAGFIYALFVPHEEHPRPSVMIANIAAWAACIISAIAVFMFATYGFAIRLLAVAELQPSGFLQISQFDIPLAFSTIGAGKQFGVNLAAINPTPSRLFDVCGDSAAYVLKTSEDSDQVARELYDKRLEPIRKKYLSGKLKGIDCGEGRCLWATVVTPVLTQEQIDGFAAGTTKFYFVTWLAWTDANNRRGETYDCRWLQPMTTTYFKKEDLVWHYCHP